MFNRQPFNRGKFNRSFTAANSVLLYGEMSLGLETAGKVNVSRTFKGSAALELTATGRVTYSANLDGNASLLIIATGLLIRTQTIEGNANLNLTAEGSIIRARHISADALFTLTLDNVGFDAFRYEMISLPGLVVRPGDELIIDMENMTVTMNGQNVMRFLSRDSEFFRLNPGNNELTYQCTVPTGRVDIRILHKDAWI